MHKLFEDFWESCKQRYRSVIFDVSFRSTFMYRNYFCRFQGLGKDPLFERAVNNVGQYSGKIVTAVSNFEWLDFGVKSSFILK